MKTFLENPAIKKQARIMRQLTGVTKKDFEQLFLTPIGRFVDFIQVSDNAKNLNEQDRYQLLQNTLERVIKSLKQRQGYILPLTSNPELAFQQREIWTFALFSAALLYELPSIAKTNDTAGLMGIAKALLPIEGCLWLSRYPDIFQQWRAALLHQMDEAEKHPKKNVIVHFIENAPVQKRLADDKTNQAICSTDKAKKLNPIKKTLPSSNVIPQTDEVAAQTRADKSIEPARGQTPLKTELETKPVNCVNIDEPFFSAKRNENKDTMEDKVENKLENKMENKAIEQSQLAEAPTYSAQQFFDWLKIAISNQQILVNQVDAPVYVVAEGVLLVIPKVLHVFISAQGHQDSEISLVETALLKSLKKSPHLQKGRRGNFHSYHQGDWQSGVSFTGFLVKPSLLFEKETIPARYRELTLDPIR